MNHYDCLMIMPVRCFSCGKPISHLWEDFKKRSKSEDPSKVLNDLGVKKYCCRGVFVGHIDLLQDVGRFSITEKRTGNEEIILEEQKKQEKLEE